VHPAVAVVCDYLERECDPWVAASFINLSLCTARIYPAE